MKCSLGVDRTAPARARAETSGFLREAALSEQLVDDIVLAVSELVTNAIDAGATELQLEVTVGLDRVRLSIDDNTGGWPTSPSTNVAASRGRGLAIVSKIADSWYAEPTPSGKRITAYFMKHGVQPN